MARTCGGLVTAAAAAAAVLLALSIERGSALQQRHHGRKCAPGRCPAAAAEVMVAAAAPPPRRLFLPELVCFDLDRTLWNRPRFKNGPPFMPLDGGLSGVRAASGEVLDLSPGARGALRWLDAHRSDVAVGLVSSGHRPQWAREWLATLCVDPNRSVAEVVGCPARVVLLDDHDKGVHLKAVAAAAGLRNFGRLLYFDDRRSGVAQAAALGAVAVWVPPPQNKKSGSGFTYGAFEEGLARYAKAIAAEEKVIGG